jgi:hypothetical protein
MKRKRAITAAILLLISVAMVAAPATTTVYITASGEKYHSDGCRYLAKSKIAVSLGDAVANGYEPCKVCKPPTLDSQK